MPTIINENSAKRKLSIAEKTAIAGFVCLFLLFIGGAVFLSMSQDREWQQSVGGPFQLNAGDGRIVTDRDFPGKYMLVYFGYTFCPDVCPTSMANLAAALEQLGPLADKLQPIFITVDPKRDTPDVLKHYMAAFSPRLLGLSGSEQQIATVEQEYKVFVEIRRTGPKPDDYLVDHNSVFYLMGPDGHFIALLPSDQEPAALAADIAHRIQ